MRVSMRVLFVFAIAISSATACGDIKPAAPKLCTKADEQCTMPSGVLGVCNVVDCAPGQAEPCLVCRSQH
jgi:hypothetical protein